MKYNIYKYLYLITFSVMIIPSIHGQMIVGLDTLYGNEWIDYEKTYYKIKVAEDGMYKISGQALINEGLIISEIRGSDFKLIGMGHEIPIFTNTDGDFGSEDYIEFYGHKNRGEIDAHLYENADSMQLNPEYSLFCDTMVYFLTIEKQLTNKRVVEVENDLSGELPDPELFYMANEKVVFSNYYNKPTRNQETRFAHFDIGEGFGYGSVVDNIFNLEASNIYSSGPNPKLYIRTGSNNVLHSRDVSINNELLENRKYSLFAVQKYNLEFPISILQNSNDIRIKGTHQSGSDRSIVSIISLEYPRSFVAINNEKFEFRLDPHQEDKLVEISFPDIISGSYIGYDKISNKKYYPVIDMDNEKMKFVFKTSSEPREIVIIHESKVNLVTNIDVRNFEKRDEINAEYLILTSNRLRKDELGEDWPAQYAGFRASESGGGYRTNIINVEDVYDEFSYGINRHSIGIVNMGQYYINKWKDFKFAFVIGKGISLGEIRTEENLIELKDLFYVPTYGQTPSDNLLFSRKGNIIPGVSVGRIAVTNSVDIKNYLDKIMAHANVTNDINIYGNNLWSKEIIHLGGGSNLAQKQSIKGYLSNMEAEIEGNSFGGNVTSYFKISSEIVDKLPSETIINSINEGVAMITFFGHSSVGTLEYSLEQADVYDNIGKYPLFLSLGCLSGNIHTVGTSGVSEDFVLTKDKGAIAFIASSGTAFLPSLNRMTSEFYRLMGNESYGYTLGEIINKSLEKFDDKNYNNTILIEEQTLHGDPAIRMYPKASPDFVPTYKSVRLIPEIINAALDSFEINLDIINMGQAISDSFFVKIEHVNSLGDTIYMNEVKILAPKFKENFTFKIPLVNESILGENKINISIDSKNEIEEIPTIMAEENNVLISNNGSIGFDFYIIDNNLMPIYPNEFGISSNQNLELLATTTNVFLEEQKYIIQIDTSELFQTIIDQKEIIQDGGLLSWEPQVNYENEKVYYWRVSPDSLDADIGYVWNNSSFLYLNDSNEGWNQSHYFQFKKDELETINLLDDRTFEFAENFIDIRIINAIPRDGVEFDFTINNATNKGGYLLGGPPWLCFTVVDSIGQYFANYGENIGGATDGQYGSKQPWSPSTGFFFDVRTSDGRRKVIDFLEDIVPEKSIVYAYSIIHNESNDFNIEEWSDDSMLLDGNTLFKVFEKNGAELFSEFEVVGTVPYTFIYQKGLGKITEKIANQKTDIIIVGHATEGIWYEGKIRSKIIGPASSWNNMTWNETLSEQGENDNSSMSITIFDQHKNVVDTIVKNTSDKIITLDIIDASKYPYIQLEYYTNDNTNRTAAQLDYWRVNYEAVPELVLYNAADSFFYLDSLYQGDDLKSELRVKNISKIGFDSLLVKYTIKTLDNNELVEYRKVSPIEPKGDIKLAYSYNTRELEDDFSFNIEINPNNDQLEQYHINNLGLKRIKLLKDTQNPILDVYFDGIQIMDEDIVSANPLIKIKLKDNSPFMLTEDVNQFRIELNFPNGTRKEVNMNSSEIIFYPANDNNNDAYLEYRPSFIEDGLYKLFVYAKDASGNISGDNNYQVGFNVVLAQKATNIINYPNPFSSSTQFIFTLTGSSTPQSFKIQIMSISGKIVKEITESEFGPLHIGINKSKYLWDGTDDFGMKLANGVYFYKVYMNNLDGENYEHISTEIDQFYNNGWGKLVILR